MSAPTDVSRGAFRALLDIISRIIDDIRFFTSSLFTILEVKHIKKNKLTVTKMFDEVLKKQPDKAAFIFEDRTWTFREVDGASWGVARSGRALGLNRGDVVALMATNRVEYPLVWLGMARIGAATALVNTHLRKKPLVHCITQVNAKLLIYSEDVAQAVEEIREELSDLQTLCLERDMQHWFDAAEPLPPLDPTPGFSDPVLYIFTSGTTGLPKAAIVPHTKMIMLAVLSERKVGVRLDDVIYGPMPLYHIGAEVGCMAVLMKGNTLVIRRKFSASAYIPDCIKYRATVGMYIGELCRYVLATPPTPGERNHCLRVLSGNGLRAEEWRRMQKRFGINNFVEYYGATEGNLVLVNDQNVVGSCGYIPWLLGDRILGGLIRVDEETQQPFRDPATGLCVQVKPGEPGMLASLIPKGNEFRRFNGYVDREATDKKKGYDILRKGDQCFLTGDLMVMDDRGWVYFHDRLGDTFRWKGENVSTFEVENILRELPSIADCAVYGVKVRGTEGRAGMAALVASEPGKLDLEAVDRHANANLPSYARPLFLRIVPCLEYTTTLKVVHTTLKAQAFDPTASSDPIYFRYGKEFVPLTPQHYEKIMAGEYAFL